MDRQEMIALIQGGVERVGGVWADLGAGSGAFTSALGELLGTGGLIYAVDRDARALQGQRAPSLAGKFSARVRLLQADITQPLDLPLLDGALMANALHFVRDQEQSLVQIARLLRPRGTFLLVEYAVSGPRSWIPYPVPFRRFEALARAAGLAAPRLVGSRRSPSSGTVMYAAAAQQPASASVEG